MYPEIHLPFDLPLVNSIKSYGICVMVAFLVGSWYAMRRGMRVKADPDVVLNLCLISLICGVAGSRIMFVAHYWDTLFATHPNPLLAAIDIREGGLEFIGGPIGAVIGILIYLKYKKLSARMFLDVLAPSLMLGVAIGRLGCFFNGCCYGDICINEQTHRAEVPWAMQFPYGSPAQIRHWENREVALPAEMIFSGPNIPTPELISAHALDLPLHKRLGPEKHVRDLKAQLKAAQESNAPKEQIEALASQAKAAEKALGQEKYKDGLLVVEEYAQKFPSRDNPDRETSFSELEEIAARSHSLPIHPTQLYSSLHGLVLSLFLSAVFYVRKRHGLVFGLMLVMYPIGRFLLEIIRGDNPHDVAGLTISQGIVLGISVIGLIYLYVIYFHMPERSPLAVAWTPPPKPDPDKA